MIDWYGIGSKTFVGIAAALGVLFVQWLARRCTRPDIHVDFDRSLRACAMPTLEAFNDGTMRQAVYFSVRVTNAKGRRTAKSCRGFLAGIDYKDEKGRWQPTEFCDNMPLAWAYRNDRDAARGIRLTGGICQFLNVFSERDGDSMFFPRTAPQTMRESAFKRFAQTGEFRLKLFVTAEEAEMKAYCLNLRWEGRFDENVVVRQDTSWP